MLTPFLGVSEVFDYTQARKADATLFAHLHAAWLEAGIFWPPSQFETGFLSSAHSESEIDRTVEEFGAALATDPLAASTS
jgi:glutamate-1-semialdehyde 2,1-aminomutase